MNERAHLNELKKNDFSCCFWVFLTRLASTLVQAIKIIKALDDAPGNGKFVVVHKLKIDYNSADFYKFERKKMF